jgi:hypothetical protein
MFTNLHLFDNNSNAFDDDEKWNWITNGEGVVDIGGLIFPCDDILGFEDVSVHQAQVLDAPMEQAMDQLKETMWNNTKDCIEGGVELCIHVTSFLKVVCANARTNHLMRGYESLYLGNILNGWKMTWVVLSIGRKIGTNGWLHTSLLVHREFLMFSDILCMHFNALFSGKTTKKSIHNFWMCEKWDWKFNEHRVLHYNKPLP